MIDETQSTASRDFKYIVRSYERHDAEAFMELFHNTVRIVNARDYSLVQIEAWTSRNSIVLSDWEDRLSRTMPFVAVEVTSNQRVGFVEFEPNGHIDRFYCHHKWQRQGIGSSLMNAVLSAAGQQSIRRVYAEVSITARLFFDRHGFLVTRTNSVMFDGVELTNFCMERILSF